eukprot:scaffold1461_cov253-Pinguiococcus_pyrenoidosus.AAC.8
MSDFYAAGLCIRPLRHTEEGAMFFLLDTKLPYQAAGLSAGAQVGLQLCLLPSNRSWLGRASDTGLPPDVGVLHGCQSPPPSGPDQRLFGILWPQKATALPFQCNNHWVHATLNSVLLMGVRAWRSANHAAHNGDFGGRPARRFRAPFLFRKVRLARVWKDKTGREPIGAVLASNANTFCASDASSRM